MRNINIISFDYGIKNIGIAVGQSITKTAQPLKAIQAKEGIPNWLIIENIFNEWKPKCIVIGLPLNMDGTDQDITERAKKFARRIEGRFGLKVFMHDERLSTVEAKKELFDMGGFKKLKKDNIDSLSAAIILESWLNTKLELLDC